MRSLLNFTFGGLMNYEINEAKFFFKHLKEYEPADDKLHFGYYFSTFVTSVRSVYSMVMIQRNMKNS